MAWPSRVAALDVSVAPVASWTRTAGSASDAFRAGAGLRILAGLHDAGRACQPGV